MEKTKRKVRKSKLFRWRGAILKSNLPCTQRYVLHAVGFHMDKNGGGCHPSTKLLAQETGLSERMVITHLIDARKKGWLSVSERRREGKDWKLHFYTPGFPQGTERDSAPQGTEAGSVPRGAEGPSLPAKALNLTHYGTEPDDVEALKEVQSSTSVSTPRSSSPPSSVSKRLKPQKERCKDPSLHTQCFEYAYESFKREFGQTPSWNGKDHKQLKDRLKKPDLTFEEFRRRWGNFVACPEEFIKKQRLSLAYFCSNFDRFIGNPIPDRGGVNARSYREVPKY